MGNSQTTSLHRARALMPIVAVMVVLLYSSIPPVLGQPGTCRVVVGPTPNPTLTDANMQLALTIVRDLTKFGEKCEVHLIDAWARANKMFADGTADVLFPEIVGDPSQPGITGIPVATTFGFVVYTRTTEPVIDSIAELSGKNVGLIRGRYYPEELLSHPYITAVYTNSLEQNFNMLTYQRIDATIEYVSEGERQLFQMGLAGELHHGAQFEVNELAFRFQATESGQTLRQLFDDAILNLKADGTYEAILKDMPLQLIP